MNLPALRYVGQDKIQGEKHLPGRFGVAVAAGGDQTFPPCPMDNRGRGSRNSNWERTGAARGAGRGTGGGTAAKRGERKQRTCAQLTQVWHQRERNLTAGSSAPKVHAQGDRSPARCEKGKGMVLLGMLGMGMVLGTWLAGAPLGKVVAEGLN